MDWAIDNDEDPLDNLPEDDANDEWLVPDDIDEDQQELILDDDDENLEEEGEVEEEEDLRDLRSLGARLRKIGVRPAVRATFDGPRRFDDFEPAAPIILYLLYPDLKQEIVQELRTWIVLSGLHSMWRIGDMLGSLGELDVEEIEQEYGEAMLEFVDQLGPLVAEARQNLALSGPFLDVAFPLHAPLGTVVAAKLLQYAGSVETIKELTLLCEHQYRAFRADEVDHLGSSILNLKHLARLIVQIDMTGGLLVELCARLKDHPNLSYVRVAGTNENLPNERHLIRNIQQILSLETLVLSFAILGESTVDLFSASEAAYIKLDLEECRFLIGDEDEGKDPRELPLAVAVASNTHLEHLSLHCVQGSGAFYAGIEQGLLNNVTLRTLRVTNFESPAHQRIPEFAYFGWIQSIRFHPSLRRLVLDMDTWSGRVADAACSVVRDNTSIHSMELFRVAAVPGTYNEFDPEWVGAVLQALQANRTMVNVRIRVGLDFGERNWNRLVELLTVNDSVESIHLDAGDESILPERVIDLLQRVKSNRTLKQLGLKNAVFGRKHTRALVELLADNYVLVSLVYEDHEPHDGVQRQRQDPIFGSDKGSESLLKGILDLNYYGRKYMRTEPNSVFRGVSLLSHVSSNLDAVYFHVRENPRLCDRREWK